MTVSTILLIILILILVGALPNWGYSRGWGYGPSGIVGVIVVVLIILLLMGRI
ncbi:MAG TPA: DUF3309 family protein [Bradyrhizobium sp.]|nr:DUF3309 family protein [Bradyrhizobium sp.]